MAETPDVRLVAVIPPGATLRTTPMGVLMTHPAFPPRLFGTDGVEYDAQMAQAVVLLEGLLQEDRQVLERLPQEDRQRDG